MNNKKAPKGKIYQCQACGKFSKDLYGDNAISYGWDSSCVLNSIIVDEKWASCLCDEINSRHCPVHNNASNK